MVKILRILLAVALSATSIIHSKAQPEQEQSIEAQNYIQVLKKVISYLTLRVETPTRLPTQVKATKKRMVILSSDSSPPSLLLSNNSAILCFKTTQSVLHSSYLKEMVVELPTPFR